MAKNKVDELVVDIKGDVSDLLKKLDQASDATATTGKRMQASFGAVASGVGALTKSLGTFGLAVEGAQAALAPFGAAMEHINSKVGLARMADRVGVNVKQFQKLAFAAQSVGSDAEGMSDAIKDLGVKVTDTAKHGGALTDALEGIGLNAKELAALAPEQQFLAFADAIAKADKKAGDFAADEVNDAMYQLIPLLRQGAEGFEKIGEKAEEAGAILSESDLNELKKAKKSTEELKIAWDGVKTQMLLVVDGPLKSFLDGLKEGLKITKAIFEEQKKATEEAAKQATVSGATSSGTAQIGEGQGFEEFGIKPPLKGGERQFDPENKSGLNALDNLMNRPLEESLGQVSGLPSGEELEAPEYERGGGSGSFLKQFYGVDDDLIAEDMEKAMAAAEELQANVEESQRLAAELGTRIKLEAINEELKNAKDAADAEIKLEKMKQKAKADILRNLSSLMNTENRKMFEVGKAAAIGQSIMNTYQGATKALAEVPYPYNFVAAASVVAAGLNNVNNIRSQSFGGAGAGAASTGGAEGVGAGGDVSGQQQGPTNVTEATINITGDNISGDSARALVAQLREYQEDGGELLIK